MHQLTSTGTATGPLVEQARAVCTAHFDAVSARDWDAVRRGCSPDVLLPPTSSTTWSMQTAAQPLRGHGALIAYLVELHRQFPGLKVEIHETAASPGHVVFENRYLAPPGASWELNGASCTILTVRAGLIAQIRQYYMPALDDRVSGGEVLTPGQTFRLAEEQSALRRVSNLVARGAEPDEVFAAVAREIGQLIGADATSLFQFHADATMELTSVWSRDDATFPVGDRRPMNQPMIELRASAVPLRFEALPEGSPFLEEARAYGIETAMALPLLVEDSVWGVVFGTSKRPEPFPPDAEDRAMRFTSLAGIALAHARTRASLARSHARVLAAAEASRRQVQRDLHDGAQQRLVHAIIELKLARDAAAGHDCTAGDSIAEALHQAERANAELRDLVRGTPPAALSELGLRAAIGALTDHLPMQVTVHSDHGRLPPSVETAAYFVIAEALTNAVKHARAGRVDISGVREGGDLLLEVRDDGVGGADPERGTGLVGLVDRIAAHDGTFVIESPSSGGTTIRVRLPLPVD